MAIKPLKISILGDSRQAVGALRAVTNAAAATRRGLAVPLAAAGIGIGVFAAITQARRGLAAATGIASDVAEASSAIGVVYGSAARSVLQFAQTSSTSLGESTKATLTYLQTFGTFGKIANLNGKSLSDFSIGLTRLSGDLASFSNTSVAEASGAIASALAGETEPLRRYGVVLNETVLRQRALSLGLIKSTKTQLSGAQKVKAVQAEVLAQTRLQQGDFARTATGAANQGRTVKALLTDSAQRIGQAFLPSLRKGQASLIQFLTELKNGTGVGGQFGKVLDKGLSFAVRTLLPLLGKGRAALAAFGADFVKGTGFGGDVRNALVLAIGAIKAVLSRLPAVYASVRDLAIRLFGPLIKGAKQYGPQLASLLGRGLERLAEFAVSIAEGFGRLAVRYGPAIGEFLSRLGNGLFAAYRELAPAIKAVGATLLETLGLVGGLAGGTAGAEGAVTSLARVLGNILLAVLPIVTTTLVALAKVLAIPEVQYFLAGVLSIILPLALAAKAVTFLSVQFAVLKGALAIGQGLAAVDAALGITSIKTGALAVRTAALSLAERARAVGLAVVTAATRVYATATTLATAASAGLSRGLLLLAANPVFLVIAAVVALTAGFVYLYTQVDGFREAVDRFASTTVDYVRTAYSVLVTILTAPYRAIRALTVGLIGYLTSTFNNAIAGFRAYYTAVVSVFTGLAAAVRSAFVAAVRGVLDVLLTPLRGLQELAGKAGINVGSRIPALANGGIVNRPTLALIGEAGPEAVVPLGRLGTGGQQGATYNITVNSGVGDKAAIGQEVVSTIRALERATGRSAFA